MENTNKKASVSVPHPYARIYAKKDAKRRRIWNHALEKSVFSPLQLSTVGAQDRRPIYVASLEAHIDRLHEQLKSIGCYPVREDQLAPYIGLHSKVAKSMVSSLQHDISQTNLKLLELERANAKLRESLGLPPKAPPLLVPSPPPRPRVPYTYPDLSAHTNPEPVPSYSQASTPAAHFYSNNNPPIALPSLPEPSSLSFYYSSPSSSSTSLTDSSPAHVAPSPAYSTPTSPSSLADALSPVSPVHSTRSTSHAPPSTQSSVPSPHHTTDSPTHFSMLSQPYYPPAPSAPAQPPAYDEDDAYRHEQHLMLAYPSVYLAPPGPFELAYAQAQQQQHPHQPQELQPHHPQPEHLQQTHVQRLQQMQEEQEQRAHGPRPAPRDTLASTHTAINPLSSNNPINPNNNNNTRIPTHFRYAQGEQPEMYTFPEDAFPDSPTYASPSSASSASPTSPNYASSSWTQADSAHTSYAYPPHQAYAQHMQPSSSMHTTHSTHSTHTAHATHAAHAHAHAHAQYHYETAGVHAVSLQAF
ncbi:hypothetical protein EYR38_000797 [Pleurotus pulmonarius]|nr:hypothetical protein EYR38_000797 [Pleurotus pulmonarius]